MNNITLSKPDQNLVNTLTETYGLLVNDSLTQAVNPLSGVTVQTTPLVAALIRFAQVAYRSYEAFGKMTFKQKPVSIQTYDRVRYLVLKLDSYAYSEVLD